MIRTELPIPRAFSSLLDVYRNYGHDSNAISFALTWLAGARMVVTGNVPGVQSVDELSTETAWKCLEAAGLPLHGVNRLLHADKETRTKSLALGKEIINSLFHDLGTQPWEVLPTLTSAAKSSREVEAMVSLGVAELMLDMLGEPEQDLWVPFDRWGMLSILAMRRGWCVNAAPMLGEMESTLPLLTAIEFGTPQHSRLDANIERDRDGRPLTHASHVLACPPIGLKMHESRLAQWDSSPHDWERLVRSETWAVRELVNRCKKKAVFLLPAGILFKLGQEQRMREYLLRRGDKNNELHSVVGLPMGAYLASVLPTAVMMLSPGENNETSLMVDLGQSRRALTNIDELILKNRRVALGLEDDSENACRVTREEILCNEVSFAPSRYLRKSFEIGPNAVPLKNLCEVIKSPVIARDDSGEEFLELGIPELGGWNATGQSLEKKVQIKARQLPPTLQEGDVVLSVKGSIGKTGLVGAVDPHAVVLSQSCIALRIAPTQRGDVSPEYLLMYLRSAAGQAQLEALQAGATVAHVSPQSLLSSFLVPVPDIPTQEVVKADYQRLCQLEQQVADMQKKMQEIVGQHWSA